MSAPWLFRKFKFNVERALGVSVGVAVASFAGVASCPPVASFVAAFGVATSGVGVAGVLGSWKDTSLMLLLVVKDD